jgi:hypothetical protein
MSTASDNKKSPSKEIKRAMEEVAAIADSTKSRASQIRVYADGSQLEIAAEAGKNAKLSVKKGGTS